MDADLEARANHAASYDVAAVESSRRRGRAEVVSYTIGRVALFASWNWAVRRRLIFWAAPDRCVQVCPGAVGRGYYPVVHDPPTADIDYAS